MGFRRRSNGQVVNVLIKVFSSLYFHVFYNRIVINSRGLGILRLEFYEMPMSCNGYRLLMAIVMASGVSPISQTSSVSPISHGIAMK